MSKKSSRFDVDDWKTTSGGTEFDLNLFCIFRRLSFRELSFLSKKSSVVGLDGLVIIGLINNLVVVVVLLSVVGLMGDLFRMS